MAVTGVISGDITGETASPEYEPTPGYFNVLIDFNDLGRGTVHLQRKLPGMDWKDISADKTGNIAEYSRDINTSFYEPETGVKYRVLCTKYTGSNIHYRFGP